MPASPSSKSNLRARLLWGVRILLALAFGAAGAAKLTGAPMMVEVFEAVGIGQWFRYCTGLIEVGGTLLLLLPAMGFYGSALLTVTMVGATLTHLVLIGGSPVAAIVLGAASAWVALELRPGRVAQFNSHPLKEV